MMRGYTSFAIASACAAMLLGCQPNYDGVEVTAVAGQGSVENGVIMVSTGQAVVVDVEPLSSHPFEDYEEFNVVRLESLDPDIADASPTDTANRFIVLGVGEGSAELEVIIDTVAEGTIRATVSGQ